MAFGKPKACHEDDVLYANARWTSIRFVELIATYSCRGRLKRIAGELDRNAAAAESI